MPCLYPGVRVWVYVCVRVCVSRLCGQSKRESQAGNKRGGAPGLAGKSRQATQGWL